MFRAHAMNYRGAVLGRLRTYSIRRNQKVTTLLISVLSALSRYVS